MACFIHKMRPQGIMEVMFIILDWIFVLMNTATMVPCRRNWNWNCPMLSPSRDEVYLLTFMHLSRAKKLSQCLAAEKLDLQVFFLLFHWQNAKRFDSEPIKTNIKETCVTIVSLITFQSHDVEPSLPLSSDHFFNKPLVKENGGCKVAISSSVMFRI